MRARFLALQGRDHAAVARHSASAARHHGLVAILETPGFVLLTDSDDIVPLGTEDGMILGRVFKKSESSERIHAIDNALAAAVVASRGSYLIERYWGGYVAFIARPSGPWQVVRDPSGEVDCCYWSRDDLCLLASDMALADFPGVEAPAPDWDALALYLQNPSALGRRTALEHVGELAAGERLSLTRPLAVEPLWSPWDHISAPDAENGQIERLRATIATSCRAWSDSFDRICLRLSGGLDSSVIAACIDGHEDVRCLNLLSPSPSGDERRFAEAVADRFGLSLHVHSFDLAAIDLEQVGSTSVARPVGRLIGQASDSAVLDLLGDCANAASFNGEGGDNVFCFLQSPLPLMDRLGSRGHRAGAFSTWRDVRQLTQTSMARSGLWMIRRLLRDRSPSISARNTDLLSGDAVCVRGDEISLPSWLLPPRDASRARIAHVAAIYRAQARGRQQLGGHSVVSPLVSQPIVEAALRIPTWRWCEGGIDRAPVRTIFADRLPPSIMKRRWKGGPDGFCIALVSARRDELRTRLLDGCLADAGLIDREAVAVALSDAGISRADLYFRILELAEAEAWARRWLGRNSSSRPFAAVAPSTPSTGPDRHPARLE